jgi:transcription elongation factor Elf1
MAEPTCPECGHELSVGLEDPDERLGHEEQPLPRLQCSSCGWSTAGDQPGVLGGDNGGA